LAMCSEGAGGLVKERSSITHNEALPITTRWLGAYNNFKGRGHSNIKRFESMNDDLISAEDEIKNLYLTIDRKMDSLGIFMHIIGEFIADQNSKYPEEEFYMDFIPWAMHVIPHVKNTFILALSAIFESSCDEICDDIAKRRKIEISRKDLSGGMITSFKKYLETFGGVSCPNSQIWGIVDAIYLLRNVIIHGNGDISKTRLGSMRLINFLERLNVGFSLGPPNSINLSWSFKTPEINESNHFDGPQKRTLPARPEPTEKSVVSFTADFCDFALKSFSDLFKILEKEHLKLAGFPRIVK
jgi:hypothetical protein